MYTRKLKVKNYIIDTPISEILKVLKISINTGKLKEIININDPENIVVTCPSNEHKGGFESHASCNIYVGNDSNILYGLARCFSCGYVASFAKFVGDCFNCSEQFGESWLIKNFDTTKINDDIIISDFIKITEDKQKINILDSSILNNYQSYCPYLAKRGISQSTAEFFNVKYDPQYKQVVFPIYNPKSQLVMFARRSISNKVFYMTKSAQKEVYGLDKIIQGNYKQVMIVEGLFDLLTCWEHRIPAIATLGQISEYQIEQINKVNIPSIYLCFDNDAAGRRFNSYIKDKLNKTSIITEISLPPNRKDVNDLINDEWNNLIKNYNLIKI